MAESIQKMREQRNEAARETRALLDRVGASDWSDDHQRQYDDLMNKVETLDSAIQREQRLMDMSAEEHFRQAGGTEADGEAPQVRQFYQRWLRRGDNGLSAEEWQAVRNTLSTGTDSQGGYTVPTEVVGEVIEALKAYGGMREVAQQITTENGREFQYPTSDGTSEEGEIVDENAEAGQQNPSFDAKNLRTYKYGSKVITVPIELLQDTAVDLEGLIRRRMVDRIGRIQNRHFTTGDNDGKPEGVMHVAPVGRTGATSADPKITYMDLLALEHSVDPAYRSGAGFMMHDTAMKTIRELKDDHNRPLFLPSYDRGIQDGAPAQLMNYPVTINQEMAEAAADAKSLAFGDFNYYIIRDAMEMAMFRFTDSPFTRRGQVGFLAWMRSGGRFVDGSGGAVKAFQHGPAA